jgi:hypothetical protein
MADGEWRMADGGWRMANGKSIVIPAQAGIQNRPIPPSRGRRWRRNVFPAKLGV